MLLPVPRFDPAWLPDLVRPLCLDICSSLPAPLDYVAVNLFTSLGTVLGNKLLVEAKDYNSWLEAPNIWGLAIGDVSQMKTPSARPFIQQMNRLQAREQRQYEREMGWWQSAMAFHEALDKQLKAQFSKAARQTIKDDGGPQPHPPSISPPPIEPKLKHYFSTDTSYEKLGELCLSNPNGVLVYGDELSGLLATLNREDMRKGRSFYLEGFNGTSSYKVDRIGRGTLWLERYALGVLGNIQPDPLCQLLMKSTEEGQQNDGLAQRFGLLVWPDAVPLAYVDQSRPPAAFQNACAVFDAFAELDPQKAGADNNPSSWEWFIRLDLAAHARFVAWLTNENFPIRQNANLSAAMRSHIGKYPKLVLGLALMLHLMDLVQLIPNAPPQDPQGAITKLTPITLPAV
jgi:hypothetical protein